VWLAISGIDVDISTPVFTDALCKGLIETSVHNKIYRARILPQFAGNAIKFIFIWIAFDTKCQFLSLIGLIYQMTIIFHLLQ
jgi:hypothetical protein